MTFVVLVALGIAGLMVTLSLAQSWARRGGIWRAALALVLAALGFDALRLLRWHLIDIPGGGPVLPVLGAVTAALCVSAWLRWRELP